MARRARVLPLRELGRDATSTIAVTADNGESFGEEGQWLRHGDSLDDAETHVLLLLRFAGSALQGRYAGAVGLADVHEQQKLRSPGYLE